MTWSQLAEELDLGVSGKTIKRHMGSMDSHKCIACSKGWMSQKLAQKRKEWATIMLDKYPKPEDWHRVRFSNELHWSIGAEEKIQIIRKPGERYCSDCIQHTLDRTAEKSHRC